MVLAFSHLSIMPSPLILAVPLGTGTIKCVLLALNTGSSITIRSVCLSLINVPLLIRTETALPALRDTTLKTEHVSSLPSIMPSPLILAVPPGTGTTKFVLPAHSDGCSTLKRSVFPFLTNARLPMRTVTALLASRDTTLRMVSASSQASITPSQLILDALHGTGTIRFVLPAQNTGFSMIKRSVCPSLTNALHQTPMETA